MAVNLKREAARQALSYVEDGMRLGLGTGSTAAEFVALLGERVRDGLQVIGVPTSEATRRQAEEEGIPLTTLEETPELDLTIDGADEIGPELALIKGGGGALLREKVVAAASERMLVIADQSKLVPVLGAFPLPIEVIPFGLGATEAAIKKVARTLALQGEIVLRKASGSQDPFITDGGHYILDASFRQIPDPEALADALRRIPGVVEHGLFLGLARIAVVAAEDDIKTLKSE